MSQVLFRCQGVDVREVTISRAGRDAYDLTLNVYVLERFRTVKLHALRELPNCEDLLTAASIVISDDGASHREFGSVLLEVIDEAQEEYYADAFEISS